MDDAEGHRSVDTDRKEGGLRPLNVIPLILTFSHPGEGTLARRVAETVKRVATPKTWRWTSRPGPSKEETWRSGHPPVRRRPTICSPREGERARQQGGAAGRPHAAAHARGVRRPGASGRAGPAAARDDRRPAAALADPVGAAGQRQDDAGPAHRALDAVPTSCTSPPCSPASRSCARSSRRRRIARASTAAARSSSSTRSTASTRRSRTPSCRTSRTARVMLIGATTENPSFEVIAPLLSRCLGAGAAAAHRRRRSRSLLDRALADRERGLGSRDADARAGGAATSSPRTRTATRARARTSSRPPPTSPAPPGGAQIDAGASPRRRRSTARCSTTRPARSTTTSSPPSSRACAAATPTPRCTG